MIIIKKSLSFLLIFLLLFNNSCYTTQTLKKDDIRPGQQLVINVAGTGKKLMIADSTSADTLYGRTVSGAVAPAALAFKDLKSIEARLFSGTLTAYFFGVIIFLAVIISLSAQSFEPGFGK